MKIIKILSEWPLSKVELVEDHGKKLIRKTIHKDFAGEYDRQKFLYEKLKFCKIPRAYELISSGDTVSFLMDYIESDTGLSHHEVIELINDFHNEALSLRDDSFPVYDFSGFEKDVKTASKYGVNIEVNQFEKIFQQEQTIVHGDLGKDQLLIDKNQKLFMIDFGKSFRGPGILDLGYYCIKNDGLESEVTKAIGANAEYLSKAKIISRIMQIAWFDLCQTKYIRDHDYKNNEIKEEIDQIIELINANKEL